MPNLGLQLQLNYLPTIGSTSTGGNLPYTGLADTGKISVLGLNGTNSIPYLGDISTIAVTGLNATSKIHSYGYADVGNIALAGLDGRIQGVLDIGNIALTGLDATSRIRSYGYGDVGTIGLSGINSTGKVGSSGDVGSAAVTGLNATSKVGDYADAGNITTSGINATGKVGGYSDIGVIGLSGLDGRTNVACRADVGTVATTGLDGKTSVACHADVGTIAVRGIDGDWEDDFVTVYSPVNVTINASATQSSAFAIPGKIVFIDVPITSTSRNLTLNTLAADGSTWISTGITQATSTSVNTLISSSTLAPISGKTGPGLNNFMLSLDTALSANTTLIVWSRT